MDSHTLSLRIYENEGLPGSKLYFTPWKTCSAEHISTGNFPATLQLVREDYSYTLSLRIYENEGLPGSKLYFTPWKTCSAEHISTGNFPATLQLVREDYSYTNIHHCAYPCTRSYSLVNWSNVEIETCAQYLTRQQRI